MTGAESPSARPSLAALLVELRQLALRALDAGHPVAAATIANTADRLEAQQWPLRLPERPTADLIATPPLG